MKSCSNYTELFNIKNKTLLITIIFAVVLAVLYFMYDKTINNPNSTSNQSNHQNNLPSNQNEIKTKINNLLNNGSEILNNTIIINDKFEDISPPYLYDNLSPEQKEIVKSHRFFFNKPTKDAITDFYNKNINSIDTNLSTLISRYNDYNDEVNKTIEEINYDLLRQLQRNYALAHKVNTKRNIELQDIDNLPQRFD
jgi:hypothetical protein